MARPTKPKKDLRTECLMVHLSEIEKGSILTKARNNKMKASRYIRECALSSDDSKLPKIRREAIAEIRKTGVNINQIAHHMNQVQSVGGGINYQQYFTLLEKYHHELKSMLKKLII